MKKRGVVVDYLPWILIAAAVLVLVLLGIFALKDKGIGMIDNIKNIFTWN